MPCSLWAVRLILLEPALSYQDDLANVVTVQQALEDARIAPDDDDLLVLPERFLLNTPDAEYEEIVSRLAAQLRCHVIGGSHHAANVHRGVAAGPDGTLLGEYEKLRPYASERSQVSPGTVLGELTIAGHDVLVLICADFWFSDLIVRASRQPDLIVVPALSVSRKPSPEYSRAMWRHLCVARAYELGVFVGVSDWSHASQLPLLSPSGVSGFADPTMTDPAALFVPVAPAQARAFSLDFDALEAFRGDRRERGFFWSAGGSSPR